MDIGTFPIWLIYALILIYSGAKIARHFDLFGRQPKVETPIISSYQMLEDKHLSSVHKGDMHGFSYNVLTNGKGRVMVMVELGHNTNMHLIALGDKTNLNSLLNVEVSNKYLEKINLEGDFPSYFRVYATPTKQVELRQVLEPSNMASLVDFCRAYDFEIFHATMYVSQSHGHNDPDDDTTMMKDIDKFLQQNKPMLQRL